jgi:hypothetical protein
MSQTWLDEWHAVMYPPDPEPEAPEPAPTPEPDPEPEARVFISSAYLTGTLSMILRETQRAVTYAHAAHNETAQLRGEISALTELCTEFLAKRAHRREYQTQYDRARRRQIIPMGKTWEDIGAMFEEYGEHSAKEVSNRHHFSSNIIGYWLRAYAERTHRIDEYQDKVSAVYRRRSLRAAAAKAARGK